ncbi:MAG: glutathione S-transferase family protein [Pseudomonadota bacterium]
MTQITLYHSRFSRSMTAYRMLEELGVPFEVVTKDIREGANKDAELTALNPHGKVPTVVIDDVVLFERPAICIYLADRFSPGVLAPGLDAPNRGEYLKWMVYSVTVMEDSMLAHAANLEVDPVQVGWDRFETMVDVLDDRLSASSYIAGDVFSAADVMMGSNLGWGLKAGLLEKRDSFVRYFEEVSRREPYKRAEHATYST